MNFKPIVWVAIAIGIIVIGYGLLRGILTFVFLGLVVGGAGVFYSIVAKKDDHKLRVPEPAEEPSVPTPDSSSQEPTPARPFQDFGTPREQEPTTPVMPPNMPEANSEPQNQNQNKPYQGLRESP